MRTILWLSLGLSTAWLPAMANAQNFALISDSAARAIQSRANSPAGQATLASANNLLARSPNPVTVIQTAGRLPHDPVYDKSVQAAGDLPAMSDLALAYRLTGDRKYLDAATRYLKSRSIKKFAFLVRENDLNENSAQALVEGAITGDFGQRLKRMLIHSIADPASLAGSVREALRSVDPDLPAARVATLAALVDDSIHQSTGLEIGR